MQREEWNDLMEKIKLKKGDRSTKQLLMSKNRMVQNQIKKIEREGIEKLFAKKYNWAEPWNKTLRIQKDPLDDLPKFTEQMKDKDEVTIDQLIKPDTFAVQTCKEGRNGLLMRVPKKKETLDAVVLQQDLTSRTGDSQ